MIVTSDATPSEHYSLVNGFRKSANLPLKVSWASININFLPPGIQPVTCNWFIINMVPILGIIFFKTHLLCFTEYIEAEAKWPPFCRRRFQAHFIVFGSIICWNVFPMVLSTVICFGAMLLHELMMVKLTDAIYVTRPQRFNSCYPCYAIYTFRCHCLRNVLLLSHR